MRLLLDQGVPRRAATLLREAGIDAAHVADLGMSSADDVDILAWCRQHGAVAVTLDADFHASIARSGATSPSAIRLRVQGLKGPEVARLLLDVLSAREAQLAAGALITVQHGRSPAIVLSRLSNARLATVIARLSTVPVPGRGRACPSLGHSRRGLCLRIRDLPIGGA